MKLTAQEEYGLRCLLQIAGEPSRFLTIAEIARRESLTTAYVAKLMRVLRQAELVTSVRGQNGGFELAMEPDRVVVSTVLDALGGRLFTNTFCSNHSGESCACVHSTDCAIRALWGALDNAVRRVLAQTTLQDLLTSENEAYVRLLSLTAPQEKVPPTKRPMARRPSKARQPAST